MAPISVALIGVGWIAERIYLPFFAARSEVAPLMAYDPQPERLNSLTKRFPELHHARDLDEICGPRGPDLVVVASPNCLHTDHLLLALAGGHSVVCEKPICISDREAREIEDALARHAGAVHPSLANRFRADVARLRAVVRSGTLGTTKHVSARWVRRNGIPRTGWHMRRSSAGGGVLMDLGPHLIDAVLWVFGYPETTLEDCALSDSYLMNPTRAAGWYSEPDTAADVVSDVEDTARLTLKIGGVTCDITLAWAGPFPCDITEIEVVGEDGRATLSTLFGFSHDTPLQQSTLRVVDRSGDHVEAFDLAPREAPFLRMLSAILKSEATGCSPPIDVRDALQVTRLIDTAYIRSRLI